MNIRHELLIGLGAKAQDAERHLPALNQLLPAHQIDSALRIAHFLAQIMHESGRLRLSEENLNYSAEGLRKVFAKYFASDEEARAYARQPERIANRVYGRRMGNGDEASGDGYRYRGRGLVQLTGKSNYRSFSQWLGVDVVAQPELVAGPYAAHAAVFYWQLHGLNAWADIDDLTTITRRINGGLNGYEDRLALLLQAKALLADFAPANVDATALAAELRATHRVKATQLNLRSEPVVAERTRLALLAQGTPVQVLGPATVAGWVKVLASLNGLVREGVLSSSYLEALPQAAVAADSAAAEQIPVAHMKENRADISRGRDGGRAYPLGESSRPRRAGSTVEARAQSLTAIVDYLDVTNSAHQRYQARGNTTFCNIYATDYAYLCGVYLPRVWWTDRALRSLRTGEQVTVEYGSSVRELNANGLFDWLEDFGPSFGWQRELDLTALQAAANRGEVCVIIAQRRDLNLSGHVSVVVPETAAAQAVRNAGDEVLRPLESQAGARNVLRAAPATAWWQHSRFLAYAFWRHP